DGLPEQRDVRLRGRGFGGYLRIEDAPRAHDRDHLRGRGPVRPLARRARRLALAMNVTRLVTRFREARRVPAVAELEGFHPLKHGLSFGASVEAPVSPDVKPLARQAADLATATADSIRRHVAPLD